MASNINTTDIDTEFPVPGQDNDSQGFRDNFTTILENFQATKTEIETLQTDTVKLNADNTFLLNENDDPTLLINANFKGHSLTFYSDPGGDVSGAKTITYANGEYQVYNLSANTEINILANGWPGTGRYAKLTLHLTATTSSVLSFNNSLNIKFDNQSGSWSNGTLTVNSNTNPDIIELWTYQGGNTIYAKHLGQFS